MRKYLISFKYDNGFDVSNKKCIVFAKDIESAKRRFDELIYRIFTYNDDTCVITGCELIPEDIDLIYIEGGAAWCK